MKILTRVESGFAKWVLRPNWQWLPVVSGVLLVAIYLTSVAMFRGACSVVPDEVPADQVVQCDCSPTDPASRAVRLCSCSLTSQADSDTREARVLACQDKAYYFAAQTFSTVGYGVDLDELKAPSMKRLAVWFTLLGAFSFGLAISAIFNVFSSLKDRD